MLAAAPKFPFVVFFEQLPSYALMRAETFANIASELTPCECRSVHRASARMIWFSKNGALNFINRSSVLPSAIRHLPRGGTKKSRHRDEAVTASFSLVTRETSLYRRTPTRLTPPFILPPAL